MIQALALNQKICRVASNEVQASKVRDGGVITKSYAGLNMVSSIDSSEVTKAWVECVSPGGADGETAVEFRGDSDLGDGGRADSRLPEHNAIEQAGVCGQGGSDHGAFGCLRAAAHDKRLRGLGMAGAMKDIVHDGHSSAHIHQHGTSG